MFATFNVLRSKAPGVVEIAGREVPINADFRACLEILALADSGLTDAEKLLAMLAVFYGDAFEMTQAREMTSMMYWFLSCDAMASKDAEARKRTDERVLDYEEDAQLLYAAFLDQYGFDLQEVEFLHWWKFQSLLRGLHDGHKISRIIEYRGVKLSEIKSKQQRAFYKRMKEKYRLRPVVRAGQGRGDMAARAGAVFG